LPRKKVNHVKNLGVAIGVLLLAVSIGVMALYTHLREVDDPLSGSHEGETGPGDDRISEAAWYDDPNGSNWTLYTSPSNENITVELPNNNFSSLELYTDPIASTMLHIGLINDVNHIDVNESVLDNMRTLIYVYENVSIMQSIHNDILVFFLELLYSENATFDETITLQFTIHDHGKQNTYVKVGHFDSPGNREMEARFFYSFYTCPDTDYEFFLAYSIVKNMSLDPNHWSETMAQEEAERVFASFTCH
jgi:hypothetical protein